jgi:hypothetical protein
MNSRSALGIIALLFALQSAIHSPAAYAVPLDFEKIFGSLDPYNYVIRQDSARYARSRYIPGTAECGEFTGSQGRLISCSVKAFSEVRVCPGAKGYVDVVTYRVVLTDSGAFKSSFADGGENSAQFCTCCD